jgi:hypothetical protein
MFPSREIKQEGENPKLRRYDMPETLKNLLQDLSDAESSGKAKKVAEVCRRALDNPSVHSAPEKMYQFGMELAGLLLAGDEPIRRADVEEGIGVFQKLLAFVSRENYPNKWALIQIELGGAYFREDQTLRAAILHFENGLLVLRKDRSPKAWALAKVAAGEAYWRLGEKSEQTVAIAYLEQALTVYTREEFPDENRDYAEELASWKRSIRESHRKKPKGVEGEEVGGTRSEQKAKAQQKGAKKAKG